MAYEYHRVRLPSDNTIACIDSNCSNKVSVLFLHGNGFSKEVFENQFTSPYLKQLRLVAMDLPGHGDSSDAIDPNYTYTYTGFAEEVINFIEYKNIDQCIVAGWSLGGQIALETINRSSRVAGVFAFGAPPAPNGPLGLMRSMKICRSLLLAGKSQFTDAEAEHFEKMAFGECYEGKYQETLQRTDPKMRPNLSRSLLRANGMSQLERFAASTIPVCLVHGEREPLIRTQYMRGLESTNLFGGSTAFLEKAGHAPFVQTQNEFDLLLRYFSDWVQHGELNLPVASSQQNAAAA